MVLLGERLAASRRPDLGDRLGCGEGIRLEEGVPSGAGLSRIGIPVPLACPPVPIPERSVVSYWTARGTERPDLRSRGEVKGESLKLKDLER